MFATVGRRLPAGSGLLGPAAVAGLDFEGVDS
jgi:hypothetical protein